MVSYFAMRAIMTLGGTMLTGQSRITRQYFHPQVGGTEQPPYFYEPRIERIGNPSTKAFLTDGARYITLSTTEQRLTYNFDWEASAGGSFACEAPTAPDQYLTSFIRSKVNRGWSQYAYRHPQSNKQTGLNVGYFDGHAESLTEAQSRWPDPWWPKDTVLPAIAELNPDSRALVLPHCNTARPAWWTSGSPGFHYRVK
jgi:prepilin-type processing-associated H-X9-DG protein